MRKFLVFDAFIYTFAQNFAFGFCGQKKILKE